MSRRGFTLIELLVVIAIIAVLAAILFPVFIAAKQKALQTKCMANMRQIGTAIRNYTDDWHGITPFAYHANGDQEPWYDPDGAGPKDGIWRERVQPYTKSRALMYCPIKTYDPAPAVGSERYLHYGLNSVLLYYERQVIGQPEGYINISSEVQIPSRTILVAENWDGDWAAEPDNNNPYGQAGRFWPYHSSADGAKGGVFIFCDGHARWISVFQTEDKGYWLWYGRKPTI